MVVKSTDKNIATPRKASEQDWSRLVERSANTLDQEENETDKSFQTNIVGTEPATLNSEHSRPALLDDDSGEHTLKAGLWHQEAIHLN